MIRVRVRRPRVKVRARRGGGLPSNKVLLGLVIAAAAVAGVKVGHSIVLSFTLTLDPNLFDLMVGLGALFLAIGAVGASLWGTRSKQMLGVAATGTVFLFVAWLLPTPLGMKLWDRFSLKDLVLLAFFISLGVTYTIWQASKAARRSRRG